MEIRHMPNHLFFFLLFFISFIYPQNPEWIQYTCVEDVPALVEEGNYIWAGTGVGLYRVNNSTLLVYST